MVQITLECCTCGKAIDVDISKPPVFGFELYDIAKNANWFPILDMNYGRTLIFCCEECMKKQLTKKGTIRKRLIKD